MGMLMQGLEFVRTYIDDLLVTTKATWEDHLEKLKKVFKRLQQTALKVNANKSHFGQHDMEYLGYWISRKGIQPVATKVQAIVNMQPPKTIRQIRRFVRMINFYKDMWQQISHLLAPLTTLCSPKAKFKWTEKEQTAFEEIKRVISKETILSYPDFSQPFHIHTDSSNYQMGSVISQHGHPIAFFSKKLRDAQLNYTTSEQELLAIKETLREFRNILLGQQIIIHTDHKNLLYANQTTDRILRWRLFMKEIGTKFRHISGKKNVVADTLS
jgi:hypothetical protein